MWTFIGCNFNIANLLNSFPTHVRSLQLDKTSSYMIQVGKKVTTIVAVYSTGQWLNASLFTVTKAARFSEYLCLLECMCMYASVILRNYTHVRRFFGGGIILAIIVTFGIGQGTHQVFYNSA